MVSLGDRRERPVRPTVEPVARGPVTGCWGRTGKGGLEERGTGTGSEPQTDPATTKPWRLPSRQSLVTVARGGGRKAAAPRPAVAPARPSPGHRRRAGPGLSGGIRVRLGRWVRPRQGHPQHPTSTCSPAMTALPRSATAPSSSKDTRRPPAACVSGPDRRCAGSLTGGPLAIRCQTVLSQSVAS